ncbi:MAG: UDP-N-acetylmuramoyl-L-alanine--D-glutamate ligase [bacterium]|nr:UDP-N-acetylmuramoyl-L-alanine--D-glutamate ligase [bacterium]
MHLNELGSKKILILGFAREGQDTLLFLRRKFPKKIIGIADQEELSFNFGSSRNKVKVHTGKNYLKTLKRYDIIIKSPGISPRVIAPFITKKQVIISQTEIFFEECQGTIIGVTGTKGKSTTSSLIYQVLKSRGLKVHLVGNIGEPVLQFLEKTGPNDIFVYELSSFQLTNLKKSPHIAVFLNVYPEHLDYYGGKFEDYTNAKANITKYQTQTDFLIYNAKDSLVAKIAKGSKAQKIPFTPKKDKNPWITSSEPAILIGKLFGIPQKKIQQAIRNFKPLPHRLERVGEWKGITFYNDSLATIPEATCAALDLLGPKVHTLIAGGFDRGLTFRKLGKKIQKSSIKTLILFPTTGEKIASSIRKSASSADGPPQCFFAKTMEEAIRLSYSHTPKGKICLLSPAASSFNMFKDYKDRGEQFTKLAKRYGEKT